MHTWGSPSLQAPGQAQSPPPTASSSRTLAPGRTEISSGASAHVSASLPSLPTRFCFQLPSRHSKARGPSRPRARLHLSYVRTVQGRIWTWTILPRDLGGRVSLSSSSWPACPLQGPALELMHERSWVTACHPPRLLSREAQDLGPGCTLQAGGCLLGPVSDRGPASSCPRTHSSWGASTEAPLQPLRRACSPHCQAHNAGYTPRFPGVLGEGSSRPPPPSWGGRVCKNRSLHYLQETLPFLRTTFSSIKGCLEVSGGLSLPRRPSQRTPPCLLAGLVPGGRGDG